MKNLFLKIGTIILCVGTSLITAQSTYSISPLPFDDFQMWRETQMHYVFAAFVVLLIANILLPGWAIHKNKLKVAAILALLCCVVPMMWLVSIFALSVS